MKMTDTLKLYLVTAIAFLGVLVVRFIEKLKGYFMPKKAYAMSEKKASEQEVSEKAYKDREASLGEKFLKATKSKGIKSSKLFHTASSEICILM